MMLIFLLFAFVLHQHVKTPETRHELIGSTSVHTNVIRRKQPVPRGHPGQHRDIEKVEVPLQLRHIRNALIVHHAFLACFNECFNLIQPLSPTGVRRGNRKVSNQLRVAFVLFVKAFVKWFNCNEKWRCRELRKLPEGGSNLRQRHWVHWLHTRNGDRKRLIQPLAQLDRRLCGPGGGHGHGTRAHGRHL